MQYHAQQLSKDAYFMLQTADRTYSRMPFQLLFDCQEKGNKHY